MKNPYANRFIWPVMLILTALVLAPARTAMAEYGGAPGLGQARVSYISGDVSFNSPDTDEWAAVSPNFTLREGDRLWAGDDSKLEVRFSGGHTAWLNYESELDVVKLDRSPNGDEYQVALAAGEGSFSVRNFEVLNSVFQVDTPTASIRAYGKATFRVSSLSDGSTQVGVSRGTVEVETQQGITDVRRGELLEVDPDGGSSIGPLPSRDGWDDWVVSRMDRYDRPSRSSRYLPPQMYDYAYEFDNDGRWVSYPSYGRVWIPTVAVGWSPYSNGRWVWIGGDYVWLPYDPWYAPFHYGRWSWTVSLGWFWIPPLPGVTFWSPGYVGWCWGPDVVSWVPLAPREIYYGYGYFGPQSVNITKVKVVNITNVYINSRARNSVVVVNRDNFLRGDIRRVKITERDNPFINRGAKGTRLIGRPPVDELKPIKETRMPKPQARVSERMLPPKRLEKQAPFIKERAVAREKERSAFAPERKPARIREQVEKERRPAAEKGRRFERVAPAERERVKPERVAPAERERVKPERVAPAERERVRPERVAPVEKERKLEKGTPPSRRGERTFETPGGGRAAPEAGKAPEFRVEPEKGRRRMEAPERGVRGAPVEEQAPGFTVEPRKERGRMREAPAPAAAPPTAPAPATEVSPRPAERERRLKVAPAAPAPPAASEKGSAKEEKVKREKKKGEETEEAPAEEPVKERRRR